MNKNLIIILILGFALSIFFIARNGFYLNISDRVFAEDREDEDEDDDDWENEPNEVTTKTIYVTEEAEDSDLPDVEIPVYINVIDPAYSTDTDRDGLVDGIDPDPQIKQQLFFTDSDSDGIADAFDQHQNEDDFAYADDSDINGNGILDSYEN